MQTIITKDLGPTDHKPARIKATTSSGRHSLTVSKHAPKLLTMNHDEAHAAVAKLLIETKLKNDSWAGHWFSGSLNDAGTELVWLAGRRWSENFETEGNQ